MREPRQTGDVLKKEVKLQLHVRGRVFEILQRCLGACSIFFFFFNKSEREVINFLCLAVTLS